MNWNWKTKVLLFTFLLSLMFNVISGLTSETLWIYAVIVSYAVLSVGLAEIMLEPVFDTFRHHDFKIGGKQRLYLFCCILSIVVGALLLARENITQFLGFIENEPANYGWTVTIVGILLMIIPTLVSFHVSFHLKYKSESQPTAKPIPWSKTKCSGCGLPVEVCMCNQELEERV